MSFLNAWAAGIVDAGLIYKFVLGKGGGVGVWVRVRVKHPGSRRAFAQSFGLREQGRYAMVPARRQEAVLRAVLPFSQRASELLLIVRIREALRRSRGRPEERKVLRTLLIEYRRNLLTSVGEPR